MKAILKPLFEYLISGYTIFENPIYNLLVFAAIGVIAKEISWAVTGDFYRSGLITGRASGSFIHWTTRYLVVSGIVVTFAIVVNLIKFFISVPLWIWIALLLSIALAITAFYLSKSRH